MSDQFELFPDRAHARATDPATSHAAAESVEHIRQRQMAVRVVFEVCKRPLCHQDLQQHYRQLALTMNLPAQSDSGLRTRCSELVSLGYIVDSGQRTTLPSGRKSILWRLLKRA